MQVDFKSSAGHLWIIAVWCALGAVILGVLSVISCWIRKCSQKKKQKNPNHVRRTNSAAEFDATILTAANKRQMFSRNRSMSSEQEHSDQSEHSEKSPLVSARIDNLARIFFSKSLPTDTSASSNTGHKDTIDSILARPNIKYQYTALDSGSSIHDRSPKEKASRERALTVCQQWTQHSNGRYDMKVHLDEIGSRPNKNWFLVSDATVRTDRLMTLLPLPPDCIALEQLPPSESPKGILMELLGSLHHPYIYPVLDLGFLHTTDTKTYACLVMPFNPRGSLKDLIFKSQWNDPCSRKYTRKPTGLPLSQVQRLGRQILEALLFLKERGFPLHGHLHSGNIILQNGVARLSGLENELLGLSSRINAIMWSRSTTEYENIDVICFGHLLYEMCVGCELNSPKPSMMTLEDDLSRYPQVLEILSLIFNSPNGIYPTLEELVLCDWFRSIDLRELRGPCVSTIKPSLSKSTLNLLHAVKRRQTISMSGSFSETNSSQTPPSTPHQQHSTERHHGRTGTMDSFDISESDSESALDEVVITSSSFDSHHYDPLQSPIHFCDNSQQSDDNSSGGSVLISGASGVDGVSSSGNCCVIDELTDNIDSVRSKAPPPSPSSTSSSSRMHQRNEDVYRNGGNDQQQQEYTETSPIVGSLAMGAAAAIGSSGVTCGNQLTTEMCNYKNSKSRRLEYSLKGIKYGRSNPSQDSAFGSLTDGELSIASSSFRLSSFQSITSPIDECAEDIIISTTFHYSDDNNELINLEQQLQQQNDSAISTPCRDYSPSSSNLIVSDECHRASPQYSSLSLSPKLCKYSASTINNSSSTSNLQFDPPKILVNDQNSIYTTSPSKKSTDIEVFSQKYRVSSFEDMSSSSSPNRKNLRHVNKMAFRSLEEERRIDSAFTPSIDRAKSENKVNAQQQHKQQQQQQQQQHFSYKIDKAISSTNEKYKKLTHSSFRGSDTSHLNTTMWHDSILYRKTKIAKSNDSLNSQASGVTTATAALATGAIASIASTTTINKLFNNFTTNDNQYEFKKQLNRGKSVNEISSSTHNSSSINSSRNNLFNLLTTSSSTTMITTKSQLNNDFFRDDENKCFEDDVVQLASSESNQKSKNSIDRNVFSLLKLKQTAILADSVLEDDSLNDNNINLSQSSINQLSSATNTSSSIFSTLEDHSKLTSATATTSQNYNDSSNDDYDDDDDDDDDESPLHHDVCKIIGGLSNDKNSEEKTPLLDSVEMSPISPTEPDLTM